jgi:pimeloyl-ACP methyl ester carboxylesterase
MPTVKVNDIDMYYEVQGAGEPIVLIAGLGTSMSPYRRIVGLLSQNHRVLAFDNRGVGRTDKPNIPYTIEMMADDTAGLLKALNIMQANVVGISMGGRIAIALALLHPELVRSLVLVSTSARVRRTAWMTVQFKAIKWIRAAGRVLGRTPQPYYAFVRQLDASGGYDCTDRLGEIGVPTLIMHGTKDKIVPPNLVEEMHAGIRESRMSVFNGGHGFFFWESERFADSVADFLNSLGPAASR